MSALHKFRQLFGPRIGLHQQYRPRPLARRIVSSAGVAAAEAPLFSIVTPSYNQGRYLEATLRSVLDQNYPRLEYVVQDGGSTDETPAVLERYRPVLTSCESVKDRGQAHALNLGFARTSGAIMAYLNSDDLLMPGALAYVARFFAGHPDVDAVYGHRIIIDENDNEIGRWIMPPHGDPAFTWNDYIPQETLFWRRRLWEAIGGAFDESLQFALDWDLLLRFRARGAKFTRLPRFLGAFRIHASQKSTVDVHTVGLRELNLLRQRLHGRTVPIWERRCRVFPYLCKQLMYDWMHRCGLADWG